MFGKRKYNKGRRVKKQWVFVMYERETGILIMVPVARRNSKTLIPILTKWIKQHTTIVSDMWKAYDPISKNAGKKWTHWNVNHSQNYVNPENSAMHTQGIESSWRSVKLSMIHNARFTYTFQKNRTERVKE
jgi:transposase-like protein